MTIANRLKENESFVPTTKIPVHTNFPPNPVREIIFSKEKFELGCLKSFYPKKKQPKSSQGILKTYCAELYSQTIDENTKSFPIAIDECNNLLGAVNLAAHKMFPLVLTPEVIWFTILQGVTTHLNFHPEISTDISEAPVEQDHFVKEGNEKLEWTAIVDSIGDIFKQKYQKDSLPVRKISLTRIEPEASFNPLLATNGSTTASAMSMRTCQGLTAANATQSPNEFKRYNVIVQSCIPSIHVRGTAQDYEAIIGKVNEMSSKFALDWWASELIPVLNEFIKAVHGNPDPHFWKYIYNLNDKNGIYMPYSGWIQAFFPYVDDGSGNIIPNDFIGQWRAGYNEVMPPKIVKYPKKKFPTSMCKTNVHIHLPEPQANDSQKPTNEEPTDVAPGASEPKIRELTLKSGLIAIIQNKDTLAVQPVFGYILAETKKPVGESTIEEATETVFTPALKYKK